MRSLLLIVTLTWSINYCYSATITDPGNFFDRINPIRQIVGPQSYDNAKLNAFTLPGRVIQGISNIALAPWRGKDYVGRGGRMPSLGNMFSGLPIIGALGSGSSSREFGSTNNYGPMASVEFARPPGSGSASSSASASASAQASSGLGQSARLPSTSNTGRSPSIASPTATQSARPASPTTISSSSSAANLPSIPTVSGSLMGGNSAGSPPRLPSFAPSAQTSVGSSGQSQASTGSNPSSFNGQPGQGAGSFDYSSLANGISSLFSGASPSIPGMGQASNFFSSFMG